MKRFHPIAAVILVLCAAGAGISAELPWQGPGASGSWGGLLARFGVTTETSGVGTRAVDPEDAGDHHGWRRGRLRLPALRPVRFDRGGNEAPVSDRPHATHRDASRRAFLGGVARKAAYVAPAVLAISTRRSDAQAFSCVPNGSPCTSDLDCCSLECRTMRGGMMKCVSMGS